MEKVPDAKTLVRLGQAIGPETVRELHDRSWNWPRGGV
jgi:hypothetical protein